MAAGPLVSMLLLFLAALFLLFACAKPWLATVMALAALAVIPFWIGVNISVFFVSVHLAMLGGVALHSRSVDLQRCNGIWRCRAFGRFFLGVGGSGPRLFQSESGVRIFAVDGRLLVRSDDGDGVWLSTCLLCRHGWFHSGRGSDGGREPDRRLTFGRRTWLLDNNEFNAWASQQVRGGVVRAEGPVRSLNCCG